MEERCRIRPASTADLEAVSAIEQRAFADPWSVRALGAHVRDRFLVAEVDGSVAGYLIAREAGEVAEILNVAVADSHRRRGIARALVRCVLERLRADGRVSVFLEVRPSNRPARALYAAAGFRLIGRRPGYYRAPPEDALVLECVLATGADPA